MTQDYVQNVSNSLLQRLRDERGGKDGHVFFLYDKDIIDPSFSR